MTQNYNQATTQNSRINELVGTTLGAIVLILFSFISVVSLAQI